MQTLDQTSAAPKPLPEAVATLQEWLRLHQIHLERKAQHEQAQTTKSA